MEGNKILDLSNLADEHFDSVQKAVYKCLGSGEPGKFTFVTHRECEQTMGALKRVLGTRFKVGMLCGGAVSVAAGCVGYAVNKTLQYIGDIHIKKNN